MRLGYDLRPFLREETGVGVYLRNLLSALKIVHQRLDTIPLVAAGPQPPGAESLRHRIVAGGLEPWVRFLGHVPGRLLRSLYRQGEEASSGIFLGKNSRRNTRILQEPFGRLR